MVTTMWTLKQHPHMCLLISKPWAPWGVGLPSSSTLLGRFSTGWWNMTPGICSRLDSRASVRSGTDVGQMGSGSQLLFQFIPKVFSKVQAWALCGTVNHGYGQWVVCIFYYGNSLNLVSQSVYQNKTFTKEIVFVYRDVLWPLTDILKCQRVLQVNSLSNGFDWTKSFWELLA